MVDGSVVFAFLCGFISCFSLGWQFSYKNEVEKFCEWKYEKHAEVAKCIKNPDYRIDK